MQEKWQCRMAPSLGGGFAGTPNEVWGTKDYIDQTDPTVFFGLYGLPDFYALWRHKGRKAILWAGSDIRHLINGYWLDTSGEMRIEPEQMAKWINKNCENWVENEVEAEALKKLGIKAKVCPSFLGNIDEYEISFKPGNRIYTSVSGDDFSLYGWPKIRDLAINNPEIEFHLYGNQKPWLQTNNIIVHGRVSQEIMNEEIKQMQGALRLTEFDGFSEIIAKSLLWGQHAISLIPYPFTLSLGEIKLIPHKKSANIKGREWLLESVNKYPWNKNTVI